MINQHGTSQCLLGFVVLTRSTVTSSVSTSGEPSLHNKNKQTNKSWKRGSASNTVNPRALMVDLRTSVREHSTVNSAQNIARICFSLLHRLNVQIAELCFLSCVAWCKRPLFTLTYFSPSSRLLSSTVQYISQSFDIKSGIAPFLDNIRIHGSRRGTVTVRPSVMTLQQRKNDRPFSG